MSTRGLKGYINNGEYQDNYVSSDAYPSGVDITIAKELLKFNPKTDVKDWIKNILIK